MTRVVTWNIGSFSFLKYLKYLGARYREQKIFHEYFLPAMNGNFVSDSIQKINPDLLFLQEFYFTEDIKHIDALKNYPYKEFLNTWYHKHAILVASKSEFIVSKENGFHMISSGGLNFVPVHLNSFHASKRLRDCLNFKKQAEKLQNTFILGDTNIWSRGKLFLFGNDKKAYDAITQSFVDFSKDLISTTCFGFGLDKVFGSPGLKVAKIESPRTRGNLMDHYPVVFDLETQSHVL